MLKNVRERQQIPLEEESCSHPVLEQAPSSTFMGKHNAAGLKRLIWQPFNLLLLILPIVFLSALLDWADELEFWLCFFSLMPLAKILGDTTEEVSNSIESDQIGGLLAATFGNATEIIVTFFLLIKDEYQVVKMALLGSILSCQLFVLGIASFVGAVGGCKAQSTTKTFFYAIPLIVALCAIFVATAVSRSGYIAAELNVSRVLSCMSIMIYGVIIFFQMRSRKAVDGDIENEGTEGNLSELHEHSKPMSLSLGILCLAVIIVAMAFVSELLSDDLDAMLSSTNMTETFFAIIFLPMIINVSDALAATRFAMHDRIDLSIGICLGSSVQLASFVLPATVLIAWAIGNDSDGTNMNLDYGLFDIAVLAVSTLVVLMMVLDGNFNMTKGTILLCMFFTIAILYWFVAL